MKKMREVSPDRYESEDGFVMSREYGRTPNGNPMGGQWVLRSPTGALVDFDGYANDIAERQELDLFSAKLGRKS